jgi:dihydrofolate synthase / folylpolyglutamate synthase
VAVNGPHAHKSEEMLERFLSLHPRKIDLSLGRTFDLLAKLGHPEQKLPPIIHVAGTNGKGSTVALMRAMLEAAGKSVHVYTSPHLVRFHERIRLGQKGRGRLVTEQELVDAFQCCETANAGGSVTMFEITTCAAFLLFSEHKADYLLLETGLGGRYDSTNVVDYPLATLITPISIDHPEFLGNTISDIASAKAGIIKPNAPAFIAAQIDEAMHELEREARRAHAPMIVAERDFTAREENGRFIFEDAQGLLDLPLPRLPGRHQIDNAALAIACLRQCVPDLTMEAIEQGLIHAEWPARLQNLARGSLVDLAPKGAELWLDGAHNEAGGRVLAEAMAQFEERSQRPLILLCGSLSTKDTGGFLRHFSGLAQELIALPIPGEHVARTVEDIAALARAANIPSTCTDSAQSALQALAARNWPVAPRILICGSLYLAGAILAANGTPPD